MFYTFRQNNSGGSFTRNSNVDHYVIVEAHTLEGAIDYADVMGIYFNGCAKGIDCGCCGDRWHEPMDSSDVPSHYDSPLTLANSSTKKNPREHTVVIHYLDGRVIYTTSDTDTDDFNSRIDFALKNKDDSE